MGRKCLKIVNYIFLWPEGIARVEARGTGGEAAEARLF